MPIRQKKIPHADGHGALQNAADEGFTFEAFHHKGNAEVQNHRRERRHEQQQSHRPQAVADDVDTDMGAAHITEAQGQKHQQQEHGPFDVLGHNGGVVKHLAGHDLENPGGDHDRDGNGGGPKADAGDQAVKEIQKTPAILRARSWP
jgi:hypothetical protein